MEAKHTETPQWISQDESGGFVGSQGWRADYDRSENTCCVPIQKKGKVVALVVAAGDYFETERQVKRRAAEIVRACNKYDAFASTLELIAHDATLTALDMAALARSALAKTGA